MEYLTIAEGGEGGGEGERRLIDLLASPQVKMMRLEGQLLTVTLLSPPEGVTVTGDVCSFVSQIM